MSGHEKVVVSEGPLDCFSIETTGKAKIGWELRDIPARKGQMAANFLVPSSGPQENMLMASENE